MQSKSRLPKTSKQQIKILYLLYCFRYLSTIQIQYFLHHKNPTRIRMWLKSLYDNEYVGRYEQDASFVGNRQPYVYYLTTNSKHILKTNNSCDEYFLDQLYREKKNEEGFRKHCLSLADIAITLDKEYTSKNVKVDYFTKRELSGYTYFPTAAKGLLPDAYIEIRQTKKKTRRYLLELFDKGIPQYAMKGHIQRYIAWSQGDSWQQMHTALPTIVLICPYAHTVRALIRFVKEKLDDSSVTLHFYITTKHIDVSLFVRDN